MGPPTTSPHTEPSRATGGLRALVVEDEVPMATVIGSYLEREGFEVHLSHDGLLVQ